MKRFIYILCFTFCTLSSISLSAKIKVACIGNSITEGYAATSASKNYPSMLQQYLGTTDYEVKNFGASGYTLCRKGTDSNNKPVSYWNHSKYQSALNYQPDIVIIKLGTNDAKKINWNKNNLKAEFKGDYLDFVNSFKALASRPKIYVCYPLPLFGPNNGFNSDTVMTKEMMPMIREVAEETGAEVIDLHTPFADKLYLSNDKIHPNDRGYAYLAHLVANAICPDCGIPALPADYLLEIGSFSMTEKAESLKSSTGATDFSSLTDKDAKTSMEIDLTNNCWVSATLPYMTKLTAYSITFNDVDRTKAPRSWTFQGSTNGLSWKNIHEQKDIAFNANETKVFNTLGTSFSGTPGYKMYRILFSETNGSDKLSMAEWQLYGAEQKLGNSLLTDKEKLSVQYDNGANLIDKNVDSKYSAATTGGGLWIKYELDEAAVVTRYTLTSANAQPERDPASWTLSGSNDGKLWSTLDKQTNQLFGGRYTTMEYAVEPKQAYKYIRLEITKIQTGKNFQLAEWQLFGQAENTHAAETQHSVPFLLHTGKDLLRISSTTDCPLKYEIYSLSGLLIAQGEVSAQEETTVPLSSGTYVVSMKTAGNSFNEKILMK